MDKSSAEINGLDDDDLVHEFEEQVRKHPRTYTPVQARYSSGIITRLGNLRQRIADLEAELAQQTGVITKLFEITPPSERQKLFLRNLNSLAEFAHTQANGQIIKKDEGFVHPFLKK